MQTVHAEDVDPQNENSSIEQSVANMELGAPKFKAPLERRAEPTSPPVKVPPHHLSGLVKSSIQDQGPYKILPTPEERSPLLEQTTTPTILPKMTTDETWCRFIF